ncbi:hypothetical protein C4D60_Mb03t00220 [Musa balbisiana]|uniref:Thiolase N-terminal domain-containing protein n=1 Tax=Musa balbisiana TaxID=52838 RepID=A0A4V4H5S2_MUSBA|nr:hypothetical protein C4D60_Mb03t00220 [Musa balbisiana]
MDRLGLFSWCGNSPCQRGLLVHLLLVWASVCATGDSAAYQRNACFGDDVVVVAAYRTAICKSKRGGGFKDTYPDELLTAVLKHDFFLSPMETVPVRTVNRQCSSGLQAVADVAAAIKAGFYDIGIGAGLESMTANMLSWEGSINPKVNKFQKAQDCLLPMGITSENVAHRFGVARQEQDQAAFKAVAPVLTWVCGFDDMVYFLKIVDPKTGEEMQVTISVDDGI